MPISQDDLEVIIDIARRDEEVHHRLREALERRDWLSAGARSPGLWAGRGGETQKVGARRFKVNTAPAARRRRFLCRTKTIIPHHQSANRRLSLQP
jgi:hypothetical protein